MSEDRCDVCVGPRAGGAVASVPGLPVSVYYCGDCLRLGRTHPWWTLVANTAMVGGLEHAAEWWCETVDEQLPLLGRTREEFNQAIADELRAEQQLMGEL